MYWLRKTLKKTFHSTRVFVLRKKFIHPAYSNNLYYFLPVKFQLIIPAAHLIPDLKFQSKTFFTKVISPRETCFLLHTFWILLDINETFLIWTWGKNKIININRFYHQNWLHSSNLSPILYWIDLAFQTLILFSPLVSTARARNTILSFNQLTDINCLVFDSNKSFHFIIYIYIYIFWYLVSQLHQFIKS